MLYSFHFQLFPFIKILAWDNSSAGCTSFVIYRFWNCNHYQFFVSRVHEVAIKPKPDASPTTTAAAATI
jgi:hypothetical protein